MELKNRIFVHTAKNTYRTSANSFRRNYSFLSLTLCTVTFVHSKYIQVRKLLKEGNYSRAESIRGNMVIVWDCHLYKSDLDTRIYFNLTGIIYSKTSRLGQAVGPLWNLEEKSYLIVLKQDTIIPFITIILFDPYPTPLDLILSTFWSMVRIEKEFK